MGMTDEGPHSFELPQDRLATTTASGQRVYLYPAFVKGFFRTRRRWLSGILVAFFMLTGWVKIDGVPLFWMDLIHRKFTLFMWTFWADEVPLLVLVLLTAVLSIGVITLLFGRIWCGWACPQSVFIDMVFRPIEQWFEGNGVAQRRFNAKPWTLEKGLKKVGKWTVFLAIALVLAHCFLVYFVGRDQLLWMVRQAPWQNPAPFGIILFATALVLFDFGWFREQFCIIACPYGRLQSVLMDSDSRIVAYDYNRRDCINCYRCVQVCPTGIDIRRGLQMECIMCTSCIDACDQVMKKINKPPRLVRYTSEAELAGRPSHFLRIRLLLYVGLLALSIGMLAYFTAVRDPFMVTVRRGPVPYQIVTTGHTREIANHFKLNLVNHRLSLAQVRIGLSDDRDQPLRMVTPTPVVLVPPGRTVASDVFLFFESESLRDAVQVPLQITFSHPESGITDTTRVIVSLMDPTDKSVFTP